MGRRSIRDDRRFPLRSHIHVGARLGGRHPVLLYDGGVRIPDRVRGHCHGTFAALLQTKPHLYILLPGEPLWLLVIQNRGFLFYTLQGDRRFISYVSGSECVADLCVRCLGNPVLGHHPDLHHPYPALHLQGRDQDHHLDRHRSDYVYALCPGVIDLPDHQKFGVEFRRYDEHCS